VAAPPPQFFTQAELLELFDRILPPEYLDPLKVIGPGFEVLQTYAKVMERISLAVGRFEVDSFIIFAGGGSLAEGTVEFFRDAATAGAFTQKEGTLVRTSKTNREFVLIEDVVFGAPDLTATGTVRAVTPDFAYNVAGPGATADGTALAGEIDTVTLPLQDPSFAERNIQVRQLTDTTGGSCAVLDQHGADRAIERQPNEADDNYRGRIRLLPDTISPDALRRQLDAVFDAIGLSYTLTETFELEFAWNAPAGSPIEENFVYNDPRAEPPIVSRWLSDLLQKGAIILTVPVLPPVSERGMVYNDPGVIPSDFASSLGRRAQSMYNSPTVETDNFIQGAWNGTDAGATAFYQRVFDLLQKIKLGGVHIILEQEGAF
jgi:hypothetical protein